MPHPQLIPSARAHTLEVRRPWSSAPRVRAADGYGDPERIRLAWATFAHTLFEAPGATRP